MDKDIQNKTALFNALAKLQYELPKVAKDKENPFFHSKYADLTSVVEAATPLLEKHGLAVIQQLSSIESEPALTTIVFHKEGGYIESTMPLILPKQDPQGQGSAITYARRYSFMTAIGMVADDDDGNRATAQVKVERAKPAFTALAERKLEVKKMMDDNGITDYSDYIQGVLDKPIIDTLTEANTVMNSLDK